MGREMVFPAKPYDTWKGQVEMWAQVCTCVVVVQE